MSQQDRVQTRRDMTDRAIEEYYEQMRHGPNLAQAVLYDRPDGLRPPGPAIAIRLAGEIFVTAFEVWTTLRALRRLRSLRRREPDWLDAYYVLMLVGVLARRATGMAMNAIRARGQIEKGMLRAAVKASRNDVDAMLADLFASISKAGRKGEPRPRSK